jgi:hypothetical protein
MSDKAVEAMKKESRNLPTNKEKTAKNKKDYDDSMKYIIKNGRQGDYKPKKKKEFDGTGKVSVQGSKPMKMMLS